MSIHIIKPGARCLVQDAGRPGYAAVGVGRSGAADRASYALANRLVGNEPGAAVLEVTLGGLSFATDAPVVVALTGAPAPATVDGRVLPHGTPVVVRPDEIVTLGLAPVGLRTYVAFSGGLLGRPVLGSLATDTMSGLGPAPLREGDALAVGESQAEPAGVENVGLTLDDGPVTLRVWPGPRADWIDDLGALTTEPWVASSRSDRVGVRLEGTPLRRTAGYETRELPSEGVVRGSIQVPGGGLPVLFLADHPVTGGYPVVGVIADADTDRLAQVRPGQGVRFRLLG